MKTIGLTAALLLALLCAASAQLPSTGAGLAVTNGGGAPPVNPCTGAADFSDGCAVAVFGH